MLILLLACGSEDIACREGTTLADDGHCYPPLDTDPDLADVIAALPACAPAPGPGEIDLTGGCALGACAGMTYAEIVAAIGPGDCRTTNFDARQVYCTWAELGIDGLFRDADEDDVPDEGVITERIHLFRPSTAATGDGIGVDATLACFFDVLGNPEVLQYVDRGGELLPDSFIWDRYGLRAYDQTAAGGVARPDGYMDDLYLYGQ